MANANNKRSASNEQAVEPTATVEPAQEYTVLVKTAGAAQIVVQDPENNVVDDFVVGTTETDNSQHQDQIDELIRQEREAIESVPIIQTTEEAHANGKTDVRNALQPLDLPEVGQAFTEEQDAAVAHAIEQLMTSEERALSETGRTPQVSYFKQGTFLDWNGPDPFIRGISDNLLRVGLITYVSDTNKTERQLILDFENDDLFFTEPVTIETLQDVQEESEETTNADQPQSS